MFLSAKIKAGSLRLSAKERLSIIIHVTPVTDSEDKYYNFSVVNFRNKAIVSDPVTPLSASVCGEFLSVNTRVLTAFEVLANPPEDESGGCAVKLFQLLQCGFGKLHSVAHLSPSSFSTSSSE